MFWQQVAQLWRSSPNNIGGWQISFFFKQVEHFADLSIWLISLHFDNIFSVNRLVYFYDSISLWFPGLIAYLKFAVHYMICHLTHFRRSSYDISTNTDFNLFSTFHLICNFSHICTFININKCCGHLLSIILVFFYMSIRDNYY